MNEAEFVAKREPDWQRLQFLCVQASSTPQALRGESLLEFVRLYRAVSADLALVRTGSGNWQLQHYLNGLIGQAYGVLYRAPIRRFRDVLHDSLLAGARTIRELKWFVVASLMIVVLSAVLSSTILQARPELRSHFVSNQEEDLFSHWKKGEFEIRTGEQNSSMWALYATNNPFVTIMNVSGAAASFGLWTAYGNYRLGAQLGALGSEMASVGKLGFLASSLAPHGASELSGAIISGAAGLNLGWAMIAPGRRTRGRSLREAAKSSFVLFIMALVMMFIAAPFEAFFSFNPLAPQWIKTIVGIVVFGGWLAYWTSYGRQSDPKSLG